MPRDVGLRAGAGEPFRPRHPLRSGNSSATLRALSLNLSRFVGAIARDAMFHSENIDALLVLALGLDVLFRPNRANQSRAGTGMVVELSTTGVSRPDFVCAGLRTGYFDARPASAVQLHGPVQRHAINEERYGARWCRSSRSQRQHRCNDNYRMDSRFCGHTCLNPWRLVRPSTWRWMTYDLDRRAVQPDFLREDVASGEGLVPSGRHVENAILIQGLVGDDPADHFRPGNWHALVHLDSGNLELRFQLARQLLGRPVAIGERVGRCSRRVNKQAGFPCHAPRIGESLVEGDIPVMWARGHGANVHAIAEPGQPTLFGDEAHDALVRAGMRDAHVEVPDVVGAPEVRRNEHQRPIRKINTNPGLSVGSKCHDAAAAELDPIRRHGRGLSVHVEFQPLPFRPRLKRDPVFAHAYSHRGVDADAFGQAAMGVGDRIRRRYRCLTDLDLHSIAVPEKRELTDGLKVVGSPIHGMYVRVADVVARHGQVATQCSRMIAAVFICIEGKRVPVKVEGKELRKIGYNTGCSGGPPRPGVEGGGVVDFSLVVLQTLPIYWIATLPFYERIWWHSFTRYSRDQGVGRIILQKTPI